MKSHKSYPWFVVGMLWFICFFNYADRVAIYSVFPLLASKYHFDKLTLGYIASAFTWVYAITSPAAGLVGDRFSRKRVILAGLYVWSIITGLTAQCFRPWQFILVRGSEGLGEAFYFPASMSLVSDYHGPATRSRAIGIHQTSIYAGTVAGGALAGWMAQNYGWQSPFWFLAIAGMVLGLLLGLFIREPERNEAERAFGPSTEKDVATESPVPFMDFLVEFAANRVAVLLIAAYFGANLVGFVFLTWMPTFLKEKFHLNLAAAGLGATVFLQIASMVGAVAGGAWADQRIRKFKAGRIHVQAIAVFCGVPFIALAGFTQDKWWLFGFLTCFGFCKGLYDANLTASFYDVVPPLRRGTSTGIMNFVGWIGAGLGALVIGVAVEKWNISMSLAIASSAFVYLGVSAVLGLSAHTLSREVIKG